MKKVIGFAVFAVLGMVALSSCKKDYTCTCTVDTMGAPSSNYIITITATKSNAEKSCEASSTTGIGESGVTISSVCSID